jgi:rubredoxin
MDKQKEMYQCQAIAACAYIYNPERGDRRGKIPKGTAFEDLPDDWRCPACGASKEKFKRMGGSGSSSP